MLNIIILLTFNHAENIYASFHLSDIFPIIDNRTERRLMHVMHMTDYTPCYQSKQSNMSVEVVSGVFYIKVITALVDTYYAYDIIIYIVEENMIIRY